MKAYLMHRDRDLDLERPPPPDAEALIQDLELPTLLDAMGRGDEYLRAVAEKALLSGLTDPDAIRYRQRILADCLQQPAIVRQLYELAVEAIESKQKARGFWLRDSPDGLLHKALTMLELLADVLRRLRTVADEHGAAFRSDGFARLFATLERELDDDYLRTVDAHLRELRFRRGALISADLGKGNRGTHYVLRKPHERSILERITPGGPASYSFTIPARDEHGHTALSELRGRGINLVANALAQSTDHILSFFGMLRAELGFYIGCLNLYEQLVERAEPTCFPEPVGAGADAFSARCLYDACLAFHLGSRVVGNDVEADGKRLVLITGANQGGKSTSLRSIGLAQLLMQAGMFVPAESLRASVCSGVFTHFKREEDASMTRGKLDEELSRMSEIADAIRPGGVLLCNESFASTNEREGSEIAQQVVRGNGRSRREGVLRHPPVRSRGRSLPPRARIGAFSARRTAAGRAAHIPRRAGRALPTSYGEDSYRHVFGLPRATTDDPAALRDS